MTDVIITQIDPVVVVETKVVNSVIESGTAGPQGISAYQVAVNNGFIGTDEQWLASLVGPAGATYQNYPASSSISGHRVVSLNSSGQAEYTNPNSSSSISRLVGVTINAASTGDNLGIIKIGDITEPSWNWDTNKAVYLGLDGVLTQTIPTKNDFNYMLVVGFPISATSLFVNFSSPIELQ